MENCITEKGCQYNKQKAANNIKLPSFSGSGNTVICKWETYGHAGNSCPHSSWKSQKIHNKYCTGNNKCQFQIPASSGRCHVKFPEKIWKCPSVWAILLVLIKNKHAKDHSCRKSFYSLYVCCSCHIISQKK